MEQEEEEYDYQEEEVAGEDQYYEGEGEAYEEQEEQLRARPMMMVPPPRPMVAPRPGPRVVPVPVPAVPPRRGPMTGYNTFQPRVFRARPRPMMVAPVMPVPVALMGHRMHHHGMRGPVVKPMPVMRPVGVFRGKERSNSFDAKDEVCEECCHNAINLFALDAERNFKN